MKFHSPNEKYSFFGLILMKILRNFPIFLQIVLFGEKYGQFAKNPEILRIVQTSPQILTLSAKISKKDPPNFHQNQAEKAVFFVRRMKFHFSFAKI